MNETDGVPKPSDFELEALDRKRRERKMVRVVHISQARDKYGFTSSGRGYVLVDRTNTRIDSLVYPLYMAAEQARQQRLKHGEDDSGQG